MKVQQGRALQAFRRVQAWFVEHPDVLANSGSSKDALANQLDALKQVVDSHDGRRHGADDAERPGHARGKGREIAARGRSIAAFEIDRQRGLRHSVARYRGWEYSRCPSPGIQSENLVHAAQALRTTAGVYKDVFVEHGLPADFLDQLDAATAALKESVDARGIARSRDQQCIEDSGE